MTAAVSRAQQIRKAGKPEAASAVELADTFCQMTRRRIASLFRAMRSNDDVARYKTARRLLDGEHLWMEAGMVRFEPLRELASELRPAERVAARR
jgi:hypothetical protein